MERIVFDELQLGEAKKQLNLAIAELERLSWTMQGIQEELQDSCEGLQFEKLWIGWWKEYGAIEEGIRDAEEKLRHLIQAYRSTEQMNIKLVEGLPRKAQEEASGLMGQEAPATSVSSDSNVVVSRMLAGHGLQHEAWVLHAVESVLYEGGYR